MELVTGSGQFRQRWRVRRSWSTHRTGCTSQGRRRVRRRWAPTRGRSSRRPGQRRARRAGVGTIGISWAAHVVSQVRARGRGRGSRGTDRPAGHRTGVPDECAAGDRCGLPRFLVTFLTFLLLRPAPNRLFQPLPQDRDPLPGKPSPVGRAPPPVLPKHCPPCRRRPLLRDRPPTRPFPVDKPPPKRRAAGTTARACPARRARQSRRLTSAGDRVTRRADHGGHRRELVVRPRPGQSSRSRCHVRTGPRPPG